jgi:hypothetical protein
MAKATRVIGRRLYRKSELPTDLKLRLKHANKCIARSWDGKVFWGYGYESC